MKFPHTIIITLNYILIFGSKCTNAQNSAPVFVISGDGNVYTFDISEDTPVGTIVFILKAEDSGADQVTYSVTSDIFRTNNPQDGNVYLVQKLDRETKAVYTLKITASDGFSETTHDVTVNVLDSNDEAPTFSQNTYKTSISENTVVNTIVFNNIIVTDEDTTGEKLSIQCEPPEVPQDFDPCEFFEIQTFEASNQAWMGRLRLKRGVDYETRSVYQVPLFAWDGETVTRKSFEVDIRDEQDTPPEFTGSLTRTIPEDLETDSTVLTITAVDGDQQENQRRQIRYSLLPSENSELFRLDPVTGVLALDKPINKEKLQRNFFTLRIVAQEVLDDNSLGNEPGVDQTQAQVTISIQDTNNNPPVFTPNILSAVIIEKPLDRNGKPTCGGPQEITILDIADRDQGINSIFEVVLRNYQNIFEVSPQRVTGSAQVRLSVKNTCLIDYDQGATRVYNLQVVAKETETQNLLQGFANVTITVTDGNDNIPAFASKEYQARVREDALRGQPVTIVTAADLDSGENANVCYRLESGPGSNLFSVDYKTGEIRVSPCNTPGQEPCMDYEFIKQYKLVVTARDKCGEGHSTNTTVVVSLVDSNDNPPEFTLPEYRGSLTEGETDPGITIKATDKDGSSVITYGIIGGNNDGLWMVDPITGVIMATEPVDYESTPNGNGYYILTLEAQDEDGKSAITNARIEVEDINDSQPVFRPSNYFEISIPESTPTGQSIRTLTANDDDNPDSPNGEIEYRISSGSLNKFDIDPVSGVVRTIQPFDITGDQINRYEMTILATDKGVPRKSGSATLVVNIIDTNNQDPVFPQRTYRESIREDSAMGSSVITVTASDADNGAQLVYTFTDPITGISPNGDPVDPNTFNFRNWFSIDNNGLVRVQQRLNRDRVAEVSYTVLVKDIRGTNEQTATASLIITITYVNDQPPQFQAPWTEDNPYIDIRFAEEQPAGSYVTTLRASDPFESISQFQIVSDPNSFFSIDGFTGVVNSLRPIDFERTPQAVFVVTAADTGKPPLTSTATVRVEVINLNDHNPLFSEPLYNAEVDENSPAGTFVAQVMATDDDPSDCNIFPNTCNFGIVRYRLVGDPRFIIDERTGVITVAPDADLDRESTDVISLTVEAYDSPGDPSQSRSTSVQMYIGLKDVNDNSPYFEPNRYNKRFNEDAEAGTPVTELTATDPDTNSDEGLVYYIVGGNNDGIFNINRDTGLIYLERPLQGRPGTYNITVRVCDGGQPPRCNDGTVIVTVVARNNFKPVWVIPETNNKTTTHLEEQYVGDEIIQVSATDEDNNYVNYYFLHDNILTDSTPDFFINEITGMITAKRVFDREKESSYTVILVAKDQGSPSLSSERLLTIVIGDIDDNLPAFPRYGDCCTIPYEYGILENQDANTYVGEVRAADVDVGSYGVPVYDITAGNQQDAFKIDPTTGKIYSTKPLDREEIELYELTVTATNAQSNAQSRSQQVASGCSPDCIKPNQVTVLISVGDIDDGAPSFAFQTFNACVPYDAQFGKNVTTVRASDPDTGINSKLSYRILDISSLHTLGGQIVPANLNTFRIGEYNGSVITNQLMQAYQHHSFSLSIVVQDTAVPPHNATTNLRIFVTDKTQEVKIVVREDVETVLSRLDDYIRWIEESFPNSVVCINDVRAAIDTDKNIVTDWTDIIFHVIDGDTGVPKATGGIIPVLKDHPRLGQLLVIDVTPAATSSWGGFDIEPVLIPIIIILLLLLLALLLLCCLWWCLAARRKKKEKATLLYSGDPFLVPNGTVNPLWKRNLYEDQELEMNVDGGYRVDGLEIADVAKENLAFQGDGADGALIAASGTLAAQSAGVHETRTETTQEYQMSYEHTQTRTETNNNVQANNLSASIPRIETTLERGQNALHSTSTQNIYASVPMGQSGGMRSAYSTSAIAGLQDNAHNRSGIGATLSTSHTDLTSQHSYTIMDGNAQHGLPSPAYTQDSYISWNNTNSAPPSAGQYAFTQDFPDGIYQGEILLGTYRPPQFPNGQQQVLYTGNTTNVYPNGNPVTYEDVHM